jgi:hypothetical protein
MPAKHHGDGGNGQQWPNGTFDDEGKVVIESEI